MHGLTNVKYVDVCDSTGYQFNMEPNCWTVEATNRFPLV
jgi:hypothetical protein